MRPDFFSISSGRFATLYERAVARAERSNAMARIMERDATVFTRRSTEQALIRHRLGWVDIATRMRRYVPSIESFGKDLIRAGFKHVVLMGMGGSSLCPELLGQMFGGHEQLVSFEVLDSTSPKAVKAIRRNVNLNTTLFIVSSKSGSTVETRSQMMYFMGELERAGFTRPGRQFIAITDRGSGLHQFARGEEFRKIYLNPADIGGRYSALSYFGMVPGYYAGADLTALVSDAAAMERLVRTREGEMNPAIALGSLIAAAATAGADKLTFVPSKHTAPLVPWIEQLIAESTGKKGKGIVPIEGEPFGEIKSYANDRVFVTLQLTWERPPLEPKEIAALKKKGFPVVEIGIGNEAQVGGQFVLWEAATALAGYHLGINPFDEPNVTESKENTSRILEAYRESGQFADMTPAAKYKKLSLLSYGGKKKYQLSEIADLKKLLTKFFSGLKKPEYCTFLNYLKEDRATEKALGELRETVRRRYKTATLRGYGPRYLHSIGQLYKGGPAAGRFIVFVQADYEHLDIPGRFYDFGLLVAAQAIGDVRALVSRKLPTLVFAIDGNPAKGLKEFTDVVHAILG